VCGDAAEADFASVTQSLNPKKKKKKPFSFFHDCSSSSSLNINSKMASKLTTCFVCWNLTTGFNCNNHHNRAMRSPFPPSSKLPHRSTIIIHQRYLSLSQHRIITITNQFQF
jgi:hypothetical protein